MLTAIYSILLILALILIYLAGKKKIYWMQMVLIFATLVGSAIAFTNLGIEIGKNYSESQFYNEPRRNLGMAFHQMSGEAKRGEISILTNKVNRLSELWNQTKFFEEDGGESLGELYIQLLDTGKVQQ